MRYIRTKEGRIIDIDKRYQKHLNNWRVEKKIKPKEQFIKISHHNIIATADTIKELCDEFVVVFDTGKCIEQSFRLIKNYAEYKCIFGAIWTDKGLIYVAKMNDKGELELL